MGRHPSPSSSSSSSCSAFSFLLRRLVLAALLLLAWNHHAAMAQRNSNAPPAPAPRPAAAQQQVRVGVILTPPFGPRRRVGIQMALDDYYATRPAAGSASSSRIALRFRDSTGDVLDAASAAVDLIKNEQVQAIIGPLTSAETEFVAHIGDRAHVPVVSSSATSPELSPAQTPFFVRTAVNDSAQAAPIAALLAEFGWRAAAVLYEDSPYGAGILPALADALQQSAGGGARITEREALPLNATDDRLDAALGRLMAAATRVIVVHASPPLAVRLFHRARSAGMMSSEYVWIATGGVGIFADVLPRDDVDAMEGVVSLRPYVETTEQMKNFSARFRARLRREYPDEEEVAFDPTVMTLWTYDAAWAITAAAEAAGIAGPAFQTPPPQRGVAPATDLGRLSVSATGEAFLNAIRVTTFRGLAGNFRLVDGQLQLPAYEIVNIVGKGARTVGFWTPGSGISQALNGNGAANKGLKQILWPGDSLRPPKGWVVSPNGRKLRVYVPVKNGFKEFVDVGNNSTTGKREENVTGYCVEVFDAVMAKMPYPVSYEYLPYVDSSESYDKLVAQVVDKKADIVVGDVTITASRIADVDFTMPFSESGWSMVVAVRKDTSSSMWIFLRPLTTSLWLASLAFFCFTGFVVWVIEHRINPEFRGSPWQQFGLIFYFAFSTLVFSHKEKLESNLSRFVVIIWVFVVLILTSSYTASLTSMLTVQKLQPTVTDVRELQRRGLPIGYQDGSFIETSLQKMGFDRANLRNYSTVEQYAEALSKGPANGGVAALFDEMPYLKIFLSKYCDGYTMVGPVYKTDGFGFVFPRGSPMTGDVSREVLKLAEGEQMAQIENKWFGQPGVCAAEGGSNAAAALGSSDLSFESFGGLFLITGVVSGLMLLIYLVTFFYRERDGLRAAEEAVGFGGSGSGNPSLRRLRAWMRYYDNKDMRSRTFKTGNEESVRSGNQTPSWMDETIRGGCDANRAVQAASEEDATGMSPFSMSTHSEMNVGSSPVPGTSFEQRMEAAAAVEMTPSSTPQR